MDGNTRIRHKIYTGLGRMSLRPVRALVLLYSMFAVGVTNGRERELGSQLPSIWVVCVCASAHTLRKVRLPPFIDQGVSIYTEGEGKSGGRANPDPGLSSVQCPMVGPVDLS